MKRRTMLQMGGAVGIPWHSFGLQAAQAPERHALLIGVSALLHQPRSFWLKGPVNDIAMMRNALLEQDFKAANIQVLADDAKVSAAPVANAQMPLRENILQALKELCRRVRSGDAVMLYWSGHAVRARGPRKSVTEVDGLSTFLLASDVARQSLAGGWPLRGAVVDAEWGAAIDELLAKGAHVFAVMDVCHASSATRSGAESVLWRGLRVSELEELKESQTPRASTQTGDLPQAFPAARPRLEGFVGMYACEDMQRTPEWAIHGQAQGVFTYALVQALRSGGSTDRYALLAQRTLDLHGQLAQNGQVVQSQWSAPVFEGSLQAGLWSSSRMPEWRKTRSAAAKQQAWRLPQGLELTLQLKEPGKPDRHLDLARPGVVPRSLGDLVLGTRFDLQLINASAQSLYVRIFYENSKGRWQSLYPERSADAALLPQGKPGMAARWQKTVVINQAELRPESLIWVVAPVEPSHWIADASAAVLPQKSWQMQLSWKSVK